MPAEKPVSSYAVCAIPGSRTAIRRVVVTPQAQDRVTGIIDTCLPTLVDESLERVPFDPTYTASEGEVIEIPDFELPEDIAEPFENATEIPQFKEDPEIKRVRFIIHADAAGNMFFQCSRNFSLLRKKQHLFRLVDNGFDIDTGGKPLIIDEKIDAVLWNGDLLFQNHGNTSGMLGLLEYVTEATDEDIKSLTDHPLFSGDSVSIGRDCGKLQRKYIRSIVQSGSLDGIVDVDDLATRADLVGYALPVEQGKVAIPSSGKPLTGLLHFLKERLYRGPVTDDLMVANSARRRT